MRSTSIPVLVIAIGIALSYYLAGGGTDTLMGLYGIGLAAVAMLSNLGITLATDAYGPIADNAGGNAQMAGCRTKYASGPTSSTQWETRPPQPVKVSPSAARP
jgi:Na+/H+-translocating membrane pyrophosphatase